MTIPAYPIDQRSDALKLRVSSVEVRSLVSVGTLVGVSVLAIGGSNGKGTGHLKVTEDGALFQWKPPGGSYGTGTKITANGSYLLEGTDKDKWIRIQVFSSFLPSTVQEYPVYIDETFNTIANDDITAAEASSGLIESYSLELYNSHPANALFDLKAWIDSAVSGIEISDDNATWVSPTSEGAALAMASPLLSGSSDTLYIRRTIGAGASSDPDVLNKLLFSWIGH